MEKKLNCCPSCAEVEIFEYTGGKLCDICSMFVKPSLQEVEICSSPICYGQSCVYVGGKKFTKQEIEDI